MFHRAWKAATPAVDAAIKDAVYFAVPDVYSNYRDEMAEVFSWAWDLSELLAFDQVMDGLAGELKKKNSKFLGEFTWIDMVKGAVMIKLQEEMSNKFFELFSEFQSSHCKNAFTAWFRGKVPEPSAEIQAFQEKERPASSFLETVGTGSIFHIIQVFFYIPIPSFSKILFLANMVFHGGIGDTGMKHENCRFYLAKIVCNKSLSLAF